MHNTCSKDCSKLAASSACEKLDRHEFLPNQYVKSVFNAVPSRKENLMLLRVFLIEVL